VIWYGIIPIAGGFFNRYKWKKFRNRFNDLRLCPMLDYRKYRQLDEEGGIFRFTGGIESIIDGRMLWVRGEDLTMPVSLEKTKCFLLPKYEGDGIPEPPEPIRWNRVSTLTEGSKVFIGGRIKTQDNRLSFTSLKETPLMVIFYNTTASESKAEAENSSVTELSSLIIRAARTRNEYWNTLTPISLVIGALSLIYIASSFLGRPAFRLTVITSLVAVFIPILPLLPPGFLLTVMYRRMSWNSRKLRANYDLCRFGLLSGSPPLHAKRYAIRAYTLEVFAWALILVGIIVNIIFIFLFLYLFRLISF
jgi:hypothetical protein